LALIVIEPVPTSRRPPDSKTSARSPRSNVEPSSAFRLRPTEHGSALAPQRSAAVDTARAEPAIPAKRRRRAMSTRRDRIDLVCEATCVPG
jgi:hypothetical protein